MPYGKIGFINEKANNLIAPFEIILQADSESGFLNNYLKKAPKIGNLISYVTFDISRNSPHSRKYEYTVNITEGNNLLNSSINTHYGEIKFSLVINGPSYIQDRYFKIENKTHNEIKINVKKVFLQKYEKSSSIFSPHLVTAEKLITKSFVAHTGQTKKLEKITYGSKTLSLKSDPKLNGGLFVYKGGRIQHTTKLNITKGGFNKFPINYTYDQGSGKTYKYFDVMDNINDFTHFRIMYLFQRSFANQMNIADGGSYEIDSHGNGYALCDIEFRKKSDGNWQFKMSYMPAAGPGLSSTYYNGSGLTATYDVWHDVYPYTANGPGYPQGRLFGFRYISSYWWVFLGDSAMPKITLVCDYGQQGISAIPYDFRDLS